MGPSMSPRERRTAGTWRTLAIAEGTRRDRAAKTRRSAPPEANSNRRGIGAHVRMCSAYPARMVPGDFSMSRDYRLTSGTAEAPGAASTTPTTTSMFVPVKSPLASSVRLVVCAWSSALGRRPKMSVPAQRVQLNLPAKSFFLPGVVDPTNQ
jgi:hypothetical protein